MTCFAMFLRMNEKDVYVMAQLDLGVWTNRFVHRQQHVGLVSRGREVLEKGYTILIS